MHCTLSAFNQISPICILQNIIPKISVTISLFLKYTYFCFSFRYYEYKDTRWHFFLRLLIFLRSTMRYAWYNNLHDTTRVLNDQQSIGEKSCYAREYDELFTIIGSKSKYICRVLYETSLSMKERNCCRDFYCICTVLSYNTTNARLPRSEY